MQVEIFNNLYLIIPHMFRRLTNLQLRIKIINQRLPITIFPLILSFKSHHEFILIFLLQPCNQLARILCVFSDILCKNCFKFLQTKILTEVLITTIRDWNLRI